MLLDTLGRHQQYFYRHFCSRNPPSIAVPGRNALISSAGGEKIARSATIFYSVLDGGPS